MQAYVSIGKMTPGLLGMTWEHSNLPRSIVGMSLWTDGLTLASPCTQSLAHP